MKTALLIELAETWAAMRALVRSMTPNVGVERLPARADDTK